MVRTATQFDSQPVIGSTWPARARPAHRWSLAQHNMIAIRQGDDAQGVLRLRSGKRLEAVKVRGNLQHERRRMRGPLGPGRPGHRAAGRVGRGAVPAQRPAGAGAGHLAGATRRHPCCVPGAPPGSGTRAGVRGASGGGVRRGEAGAPGPTPSRPHRGGGTSAPHIRSHTQARPRRTSPRAPSLRGATGRRTPPCSCATVKEKE